MIVLSNHIEVKILTMCMIEKDGKVLLINRPDRLGFPGYLAPGGKVDFPESIVSGAIREVKEETGLLVTDIVYKGLDEFCELEKGSRYMVFNYLVRDFEGELLENPPEGDLLWIEKEKAFDLPMQDWFKRRFPYFFQSGTFEMSFIWSQSKNKVIYQTIKHYDESAVKVTEVV
ncbi:8-oxo-dGTP diphosphatase [Paenibacillus sp. GSMTC-2017]|uniref:8-oxo-dGTP diphosphatase n=1 Tax=Paenibacillus sp. GSMTC-2017 TaxID=2794350 RepID=UPI0018D7F0EE|nr:8-oxo-dGTP diphosphatase [Paenibacillus sp. GSMTC-2017]MBH5316849.1 8-oxo-dGTP diphosphatase [Paenibacillus sp. GSMTC-2017]